MRWLKMNFLASALLKTTIASALSVTLLREPNITGFTIIPDSMIIQGPINTAQQA
ncbi:hypothetical protein [Pseudomonas huanghezhanensis]|uniref:hypothetical protein n=1 Tax=Pseudomonas huanghezhanensis TaxID=3002903 RepID=UPI00228633A1|nr:hypothetical protein [Pseudomonas sp. BSw22131]